MDGFRISLNFPWCRGGIALLAVAGFGCEAPKAVAVAEPKVAKRNAERAAPIDPMVPPVGPVGESDGLRLPDMTTLPSQNEFKATAGPAPGSPGAAGIVATPPPSPARPKEDAPEPVVHPED
jgi:hypothetical protein